MMVPPAQRAPYSGAPARAAGGSLSSGPTGLSVGGLARPPVTERFKCGESRLSLRNELNKTEIGAAKLIQEFDTNKDGSLQVDELRLLLVQKTGSEPDIEFVMTVADTDRDRNISEGEVLRALAVWFAYTKMPVSVGRCVTKYSNRQMLSDSELAEALMTLNDYQEVPQPEVQYVRSVAIELGATDELITNDQLRKAVAAWYLNVMREPTEGGALAMHSAGDAMAKLKEISVFKAVTSKEPLDTRNRSLVIILGVFCVFGVLQPLAMMFVGAEFTTIDTQCEHPRASNQLWWNGCLSLIQNGLLCLLVLTCFVHNNTLPQQIDGDNEGTTKKMKRAASGLKAGVQDRSPLPVAMALLGILLSVIALVNFTMFIFGANHVSSSTSMRCGVVLWNYSNYCYIIVPPLLFCFICCFIPCTFTGLWAQEHFRNHDAEEGLQQLHGGASGAAGAPNPVNQAAPAAPLLNPTNPQFNRRPAP